jgi:hypothetical protein
MPGHDRRWAFGAVLFAAILVLVFVAYCAALSAWFANDDFLWLDISNASSVLASFTGSWGHGAAYRPLARVSFWLDTLLFGRNATPWHAHSLALHALGSALLGVLLDRLSGERAFAVTAAMIFALLPLSDEAVIWISGRMYVLCLPLALTSALLLDHWLDEPRPRTLLALALTVTLTLATYEGSVYVVVLLALVAALRVRDGARVALAITGLMVAGLLLLGYLALRRWFVGPGDFLPTRPVLSLAFLTSLRAVGGVFLTQVTPALWPFALAAVASAIWAPRMLAIATIGVAVAAAGYAPFSFVDSFGMRYLYAAGLGLAMVLAALIVGLARVPRVGVPLAALLLLLQLRGEWQGVRTAAREWAEAGAIAQQTLANVANAVSAEPAGRPVLVFGVPLQHGHGMLFFTYFDIAMRLFHPELPRLVLSAHYLLDLDEGSGWNSHATTWERESVRRAVAQLPPLGCIAAAPTWSHTRAAVARALVRCKAGFVALDMAARSAHGISADDARRRMVEKLGPEAG